MQEMSDMSKSTDTRHSRFQQFRQRLETFNPGTGWRLWLYEFLLFGFKQAGFQRKQNQAVGIGQAAKHVRPLAGGRRYVPLPLVAGGHTAHKFEAARPLFKRRRQSGRIGV